MIWRFNTAQLSREMRESLEGVLAKLQESNQAEIDVCVIEFPKSFKVKLDEDVELIVRWDEGGSRYGTQSEPEPTSEHGTLEVDLPGCSPEPEPDKHNDVDPMTLALMKYELMSTHLNMPDEKKIIFAKEYARLWSEHR